MFATFLFFCLLFANTVIYLNKGDKNAKQTFIFKSPHKS